MSPKPADALARMDAAIVGAKSTTPAAATGEPAEPTGKPRARRPPSPAVAASAEAPAGSVAAPRARRPRKSASAPVQPNPPAAPAPRTMVRYTLDLERGLWRDLKIAAMDAGVDASAIVRALLEELRENAELTGRVVARAQPGSSGSAGPGAGGPPPRRRTSPSGSSAR
jgi:hypothetical protein